MKRKIFALTVLAVLASSQAAERAIHANRQLKAGAPVASPTPPELGSRTLNFTEIDRHWRSYGTFGFAFEDATLPQDGAAKSARIAELLSQNPTWQLGLDGTWDLRGTDPRNVPLAEERVAAVRDSLLRAGVPAEKILVGRFGHVQLRRERHVEVLFRLVP